MKQYFKGFKRRFNTNGYIDREDSLLYSLIRQGGSIANVKSVTASYTVTVDDDLIVANTSAITVTLEDFGKPIRVKNNSGGNITIDGGDFNIEGVASITAADTETYMLIVVDGEWLIIT